MGVKSSGLVKINQQAGVGAQDILEGLGWRRIDAQIYETRNSVIIKHDHTWKQFRLTIEYMFFHGVVCKEK